MVELQRFLVSPETTISEVIACIDRNAKGIALVVDGERRLIGTITDGDIRRAIMVGTDLGLPARVMLEKRSTTIYPQPITAPAGTPDAELVKLMNKHVIRQIPLIDGEGRVADVALLSDLVKNYELPLQAVIMAGGFGKRLRPYTDKTPKPMLPVGDRPLLEVIIGQLQQAGIRRVNVTTHYKGDAISEHFGDGSDFGVAISYVEEQQPLGTAGALSLLETSDEPLLVVNGDILSNVDYPAMLDFHRQYLAEMTVGVVKNEFHFPYGVVETDGINVKSVVEKPLMQQFVNAGIYLLNPSVCRYVPSRQNYDMPDLISRLVAEGKKVVIFPIREYWLDIGQSDDYKQAQQDIKERRV